MNTRTYYDGTSKVEISKVGDVVRLTFIATRSDIYLDKKDIVNLIEYLQILNKDLI